MSGGRHLTEDLIHAILMRTDVKQLLRCKLLSKTYYNLINSPSFVSKHLHQSMITRNNNEIIVVVSNVHKKDTHKSIVYLLSPESQVYLPPFLVSISVSILGSCNGLIVVRGQDENHQTVFYLCNPTTREYRALPPPLGHCSSVACFGFGHDALSGDYKVVKISTKKYYSLRTRMRFIRRRSPPGVVSVEVWSTSTNRWIKVESDLPYIMNECQIVRPGLFVSGNLYWLADCSYQRQVLLSFRLADDTIHEMTSVSEVVSQYGRCRMDITELKGSLWLFVEDISCSDSSLGLHDMWLMKKEDSGISWTRHLSIRDGISRFPQTRVCVNWKFETLVGSEFWLLHGPPTELNRILFPSSKFELWSFVESLVSVKRSSEDDHLQRTDSNSLP